MTSRLVAILMLTTAMGLVTSPAGAYVITGKQVQGEQRDHTGRISAEASVIHHVACNGGGENGGRFFVYQYTKRAAFRAILPPNWGSPLGGRDFGSFGEAAGVACRRH
jgi:hypothetical protein